MIVDSHCHLDYPQLYDSLDEVIKRAELNNVKLFLTICTNQKSFNKIQLIVKKYNNVYGTFGIHPHEAKDNSNINSDYIIDLKKKNEKIIGIGETGLDFYYNHSDEKSQKKSFIEHIAAASKLNIPVIVHSRNAEKETYEIIKSEMKNSNLKVLLHCFTGTTDFAKKLIDLNCMISLSGIITFKKSNELLKTIDFIPLEYLLVETDSPYLSPAPNRGKSNEPSFIIHTINRLSEIKNIPKKDVITHTTNNFKKLFNI